MEIKRKKLILTLFLQILLKLLTQNGKQMRTILLYAQVIVTKYLVN